MFLVFVDESGDVMTRRDEFYVSSALILKEAVYSEFSLEVQYIIKELFGDPWGEVEKKNRKSKENELLTRKLIDSLAKYEATFVFSIIGVSEVRNKVEKIFKEWSGFISNIKHQIDKFNSSIKDKKGVYEYISEIAIDINTNIEKNVERMTESKKKALIDNLRFLALNIILSRVQFHSQEHKQERYIVLHDRKDEKASKIFNMVWEDLSQGIDIGWVRKDQGKVFVDNLIEFGFVDSRISMGVRVADIFSNLLYRLLHADLNSNEFIRDKELFKLLIKRGLIRTYDGDVLKGGIVGFPPEVVYKKVTKFLSK